MRRTLKTTAALVAAVVVWLLATLPPAPRTTIPLTGALRTRTARGAFHIHTRRSDGTSDKATVARAAARAGLQFAVFTEHGDGTDAPDAPAYIDGVLCLDGVEISTNGGHYIAVGMKTAPYPLGGDAAAVVEDVARLGGFGVAAHPGSWRPPLAWADWSLPMDGVEWLNADSEWRDEGRLRLLRSLVDYLIRPGPALAALLDRPVETIRRFDEVSARRRIVAIAGLDAHGGVEADRGRTPAVSLPTYESSFRTFSLNVVLDGPLAGDPRADAETVIAALRLGRVYTAIDATAAPAELDFTAAADGLTVEQGGELPLNGSVHFVVRTSAPSDASTTILHNGRPLATAKGGALDADSVLPGAYRVEVQLPGAPGHPPVPWIFSNPIYRLPPGTAAPPPPPPTPVAALGKWRLEKDPDSVATIVPVGSGFRLDYRLRPGERASQFVAAAADLPADVPAFTEIAFEGRADRALRLSVQLRFGRDGEARYGTSVYLDQTVRRVAIPVRELVPLTSPARLPDTRRATAVLFVVDLTNEFPGAASTFRVSTPVLAGSVR